MHSKPYDINGIFDRWIISAFYLLSVGVGVLRAEVGKILGVFKLSSACISLAAMDAASLSEPYRPEISFRQTMGTLPVTSGYL